MDGFALFDEAFAIFYKVYGRYPSFQEQDHLAQYATFAESFDTEELETHFRQEMELKDENSK